MVSADNTNMKNKNDIIAMGFTKRDSPELLELTNRFAALQRHKIPSACIEQYLLQKLPAEISKLETEQ